MPKRSVVLDETSPSARAAASWLDQMERHITNRTENRDYVNNCLLLNTPIFNAMGLTNISTDIDRLNLQQIQRMADCIRVDGKPYTFNNQPLDQSNMKAAAADIAVKMWDNANGRGYTLTYVSPEYKMQIDPDYSQRISKRLESIRNSMPPQLSWVKQVLNTAIGAFAEEKAQYQAGLNEYAATSSRYQQRSAAANRDYSRNVLNNNNYVAPSVQRAMQQMYTPQMSYQNMYAPQMMYPQMYAPQMMYPQMYAPQMMYPQMYAPQMMYPQMYAPQVMYPQMYAPQMMYPQIYPPQMMMYPYPYAPNLNFRWNQNPQAVYRQINVPQMFKYDPAPQAEDTKSEPMVSQPVAEQTKSQPTAEQTKSQPVAEETKSQPVAEQTKSQPTAEETKSQPVAEQTKSQPVAEETKSQPAAEQTKSQPVAEETKSQPQEKDLQDSNQKANQIKIKPITIPISPERKDALINRVRQSINNLVQEMGNSSNNKDHEKLAKMNRQMEGLSALYANLKNIKPTISEPKKEQGKAQQDRMSNLKLAESSKWKEYAKTVSPAKKAALLDLAVQKMNTLVNDIDKNAAKYDPETLSQMNAKLKRLSNVYANLQHLTPGAPDPTLDPKAKTEVAPKNEPKTVPESQNNTPLNSESEFEDDYEIIDAVPIETDERPLWELDEEEDDYRDEFEDDIDDSDLYSESRTKTSIDDLMSEEGISNNKLNMPSAQNENSKDLSKKGPEMGGK